MLEKRSRHKEGHQEETWAEKWFGQENLQCAPACRGGEHSQDFLLSKCHNPVRNVLSLP